MLGVPGVLRGIRGMRVMIGMRCIRAIWEASGRHLGASGSIQGHLEASGGILEASWRPSETGGSFTIVKMQSNRCEQPFYRRVAKIGGTKYGKTHGFRADAWRERAAEQSIAPSLATP